MGWTPDMDYWDAIAKGRQCGRPVLEESLVGVAPSKSNAQLWVSSGGAIRYPYHMNFLARAQNIDCVKVMASSDSFRSDWWPCSCIQKLPGPD